MDITLADGNRKRKMARRNAVRHVVPALAMQYVFIMEVETSLMLSTILMVSLILEDLAQTS
jgi:hypothetical protein